jgi:hypothetical protein
MLDDYVFFGKVFRWQPSEIDNLKWSYRKEIKLAYSDYLNSKKDNHRV